jgi:hypothetical protein
MNMNVKNISEIVDDIKEKLTDYQLKTIMDNLMAMNNEKEEEEADVEEETDEQTDEETIQEMHRQIIFLNGYIPTITDEDIKLIFTRRLNMLVFINRNMLKHF